MTRFCSLTSFPLVSALMSAISYGAASIGANFTAYEGWSPPDCQVAVSQNHVVVLTNQLFQVFTKSGIKLHEKSSAAFWADAGAPGGGGDARIYFDQYDRRWFAITYCCPVAVAVSSDEDPTLPWFAGHVGTNLCRPDFPRLGFNREGLFILGERMLGQCSPPQEYAFYSLPRANLLQFPPDFSDVFEADTDLYGYFVVPDWDDVGLPGRPAYMVAVSQPTVGLATLRIRRVWGVNPPIIESSTHTMDYISTGPGWGAIPQPAPGKPIRHIGTFHSNQAAIRNGILYFARPVRSEATSERSGIEWASINLGTMTLISRGVLKDDTGQNIDYFYPSLAVNPQGDVVIGCNGSGPTTFVGSYAFVGYQQPGGHLVFEGPILLAAGQGIVNSNPDAPNQRWADFSATVVDPVDPFRFWTIQETASASPSLGKMQVTEILLEGAAPRVDSVVSRKQHEGMPFDIDVFMTGNTEPRDGDNSQILVGFDVEAQPADGMLNVGDEVSLDQGSISGLVFSGRQLTINVTNVPDGLRTLTLSGFSSVLDNSAQMQSNALHLRSRIGDVDDNDQVTNCDVAQVQASVGRTLDQTTFRNDIDLDGDIDGNDVDAVHNHLVNPCHACDSDDDCNANGVLDFCDIASGTSQDSDGGGIPDECEVRVIGWSIVQQHAGSGDLATELDATATGGFVSTESREAEVTRLAIDFNVPVDVLDFPTIESSDGLPVLPPFDAIESNGKRTFEYRFQGSFRDGVCYRIDVAQSFSGADVNHPTYGKFVAGDTDCEFRVLTGDVDANGWVLYADRALIEARFGAVSQENAGFDLNLDGVVDPADVQIAQSRIGHFSSTCALAPYDFNRDGHVDTDDLSALKACRSRASVPVAPGCEPMDLDADGDSDQDDFGLFQRCASGENVPADPYCGG